MSSRSTRKAVSSVIDVADQQTASDPEPAATDVPSEQDAISDATLAVIAAESPASDDPATELIDTDPAIETAAVVDNGVEQALLVDPADRSVVQFETGLAPRTLRGDEPIHFGTAAPGFRLTVHELFGSLRLDP